MSLIFSAVPSLKIFRSEPDNARKDLDRLRDFRRDGGDSSNSSSALIGHVGMGSARMDRTDFDFFIFDPRGDRREDPCCRDERDFGFS